VLKNSRPESWLWILKVAGFTSLARRRTQKEFGFRDEKVKPYSSPQEGQRLTRAFASILRRVSVHCPLLLLVFLISAQRSHILASESLQARIEHDVSLVAQGKFHEAETDLREIIKQVPDSFPAYKLLGVVYMREGNYAESETALQMAMQLSQGKDPQTLYYLSQVEFALKKSNGGLKLAMQAITLAPDNPQALYSVGRLLRENSFPAEAVQALNKAHDLVPTNAAITTELILGDLDQQRVTHANTLVGTLLQSASFVDLIQAGTRFGEGGRNELAVRVFQRAVEIRPGAYDGEFNLAFSYYRQKEFVKALDTLDKIPSSEKTQHADFHYLRGKVQLALGDDKLAKEELLSAVQQEPGDESLCMEAGLLFLHYQNFWQALGIFARCSEALPRSSPVDTGLGLTYLYLGKYAEAIDTFKKVLGLQPDADAAREALGFLLYVTGKLEEAEQILEQRIKGGNADYYIYYLNALVLLRENSQANRTRALNSLAEALRRQPHFPPAFFERGRIEFEAGNFTQALLDFQKATELDPDYAEPYALMARAYFKLGQRENAEQAQRKYLSTHHEQEEKEQKRTLQDRLFKSLQ
jgi:tetratricopeptide (TPR) repeat protein